MKYSICSLILCAVFLATGCDETGTAPAGDGAPELMLMLSPSNDCGPNLRCAEWCVLDPVNGREFPTGLSCCIPADFAKADVIDDPVAWDICMANLRQD